MPSRSKLRSTRRRRAPGEARGGNGEFALATLAHEVRTGLNGILALSELLAVSDLPRRQREWARSIAAAATHIANLTTVVVDGARASRRKLILRDIAFDLPALAAALAQSLAARAAVSGIASTVTIADDLPPRARGDAARLRAAVENLIDNAVKFSRGGSVRLAVTVAEAGPAAAQIGFAVSDEGAGLTAAELRRLFRPFGQARASDARLGGAGLGLCFARRVARAMGGDLTAESRPGAGSTFRLSVRLALATEPTAEPDGGWLPVAQRPLRLLCAEDNAYGRVVLNTLLTALGHSVDFVETGTAAVEAAIASRYDAVLMDVVLAGSDGLAAARALRARQPAPARTPVIGLSGRAAEEAAALAAGMDLFLAKPVGAAALAAALARIAPSGDASG